jgi:hypothetical protein
MGLHNQGRIRKDHQQHQSQVVPQSVARLGIIECHCVSIPLVILSLLSYTQRMRLIHYRSSNGKDVYQSWLDSLRDIAGRIAVMCRVFWCSLTLRDDQNRLNFALIRGQATGFISLGWRGISCFCCVLVITRRRRIT